jgi:hypothetical protein
LFNFVLTTLTGRRLYGASLLLRHPDRTREVICVCVLSALPLLQHLRDALATLLDAPSDTVEELLGCDPFQRLVAFTRPCKAPVDLFGSEASPLRVSVCVCQCVCVTHTLPRYPVPQLEHHLAYEGHCLRCPPLISACSTSSAACIQRLLSPWYYSPLSCPLFSPLLSSLLLLKSRNSVTTV